MKGSKMLGKSIFVIVLSLVLVFSAIAPMAVMGSENFGGSNGDGLGQYRYYSVKGGETLTSIAQKNGITVSDIMTFNGLDSNDRVYKGQVLKLPLTTANSDAKGIVSTQITLRAKDANVKDLVSALAYNAGYTVIYKGTGSETVTVNLEKVSPLKAIDYVTRLVGLSFIKDGNTIMVSTADDLNSTFIDSIVLTKFSFKYITFDELLGQAGALGLSNIKSVSQSNNQRDVWISAYPKEMAKLHELVKILDASENISVGSSSIASAFTPLELDYITAAEFSSLLSNLGLHAGITTTSRPYTLFTYVSGTALADIMKIKAVVDTEAAVKDGDTITPPPTVPNTKPDEESTTSAGTENPTEPTTAPIIPDVPVDETVIYEKVDLVNISRSDAEQLISMYIKGITTYGHDRMTKSLWLFGSASAIAEAKALISSIDENVATAASTVHTYTAQNCTVDELMARLSNVKYENVSFYTYDHSNITNNIIVYCDDVTWNNEIHELLVTLDTVDTGAATWLPLDSFESISPEHAKSVLTQRFDIMKSLYPEIYNGVKTNVVVIPDGEGETMTYKGVMYVWRTSDQVTRMKNLLDAMDNA